VEASNVLRDKYVAETNVDGNTKREELITAKMREDAFATHQSQSCPLKGLWNKFHK